MKEFYLGNEILLQIACRERIKDVVIIKDEVRFSVREQKVFWGLGRRKVAICLFWFDLRPSKLDKKYTSPPTTLTTRPRQGAQYLNFELERGGENKKDFCFFLSRMTNKVDVSFSRTDSNSGVEAQKTILYQLLKSPNSSDCTNLRSRGSTSLFVLEARGKGRLIYLLYAAFFLPLFPSTDFRAIPDKKSLIAGQARIELVFSLL